MRSRGLKVDENTKGSTVIDQGRVADETGELRGDISEVRACHVREPEIRADEGHVVFVIGRHLLLLGRVRRGALGGGEDGSGVIG